MIRLLTILVLLLSSLAADAGTISRQSKSFGGTSFINGVVPTAGDFNGDIDTIYSEFNGNITNANVSSSAAILGSKITPDFTANISNTGTAPCNYMDESDQASDARRWYLCVSGSVFSIASRTDAGVLQNTWLSIVRANGGTTIGGTGGTNTINGATTFNQAVTFASGTNLLPTGTVQMYLGTTAPSGWLLMDGSSNSCTTYGDLCTLAVALYGSVNYKGASTASFTVDTSSDEIIQTAHGKSVNDRVHFTSATTLPAGLSATVVYFIKSVTTDRYVLSLTAGGATVDITTTGTGTHSNYYSFLVPDMRGRSPVGTGTGSGLSARTIGAIPGSENISEAMMPAHTHGVTDPGHSHSITLAGVAGSQSSQGQWGSNDTTNVANNTSSATTGITTQSAGSSLQDGNFQPSLVITFVIKT